MKTEAWNRRQQPRTLAATPDPIGIGDSKSDLLPVLKQRFEHAVASIDFINLPMLGLVILILLSLGMDILIPMLTNIDLALGSGMGGIP